jgi:hypothetical protein
MPLSNVIGTGMGAVSSGAKSQDQAGVVGVPSGCVMYLFTKLGIAHGVLLGFAV